jgi:hypothetical protein
MRDNDLLLARAGKVAYDRLRGRGRRLEREVVEVHTDTLVLTAKSTAREPLVSYIWQAQECVC